MLYPSSIFNFFNIWAFGLPASVLILVFISVKSERVLVFLLFLGMLCIWKPQKYPHRYWSCPFNRTQLFVLLYSLSKKQHSLFSHAAHERSSSGRVRVVTRVPSSFRKRSHPSIRLWTRTTSPLSQCFRMDELEEMPSLYRFTCVSWSVRPPPIEQSSLKESRI